MAQIVEATMLGLGQSQVDIVTVAVICNPIFGVVTNYSVICNKVFNCDLKILVSSMGT